MYAAARSTTETLCTYVAPCVIFASRCIGDSVQQEDIHCREVPKSWAGAKNAKFKCGRNEVGWKQESPMLYHSCSTRSVLGSLVRLSCRAASRRALLVIALPFKVDAV
eukprot:6180214-Pleurochrysis_carterae.AAC.6